VTVSRSDGSARLVVRDHGIGIRAEDAARIFERFERGVPVTHYGGFGLGLWIVRTIVEAFGGHVSVESAPETGTAFAVELPLGS
jgi:signal transduction histidine kinase